MEFLSVGESAESVTQTTLHILDTVHCRKWDELTIKWPIKATHNYDEDNNSDFSSIFL